MILSEYDRRWAEVRFYEFCRETYAVNQKSIDILDYAELICSFGNIDAHSIKTIIRTMMNDTYYRASKREIILLAHIQKIPTTKIGKYLEMSRQGVNKYIRCNIDNFTPLPRCNIEDDTNIVKFLNTLDKIRTIGSLNNGTTDKEAI